MNKNMYDFWSNLREAQKHALIASILIITLVMFTLFSPDTTGKVLSILKDILVALAAIFAAYVAKEGLISWKKELSGKANFDVARNIARATYKLRDELQYCRSPWIPLSEFPKDYDTINRTPESEADAYYHIYSNRWKPVADALQVFEVEALEAEVLWGSEFKSLTDEMRQCCRNLQVAMEAHISNFADGNEAFKNDPDFGKTIKAEVMNTNRKNNPLTQKIEKIVIQLEHSIKPHIKNS